MSAVLGVLLLVVLFLAFPLVTRERTSAGCATGGCWKKRLGLGCGACTPGARDPADAGE